MRHDPGLGPHKVKHKSAAQPELTVSRTRERGGRGEQDIVFLWRETVSRRCHRRRTHGQSDACRQTATDGAIPAVSAGASGQFCTNEPTHQQVNDMLLQRVLQFFRANPRRRPDLSTLDPSFAWVGSAHTSCTVLCRWQVVCACGLWYCH